MEILILIKSHLMKFELMIDHIDAILVIVAGVILAAYVGTLSITIAGGDSGEIVAEGCHLGTAHPPGYPLITLIINGISRLNMVGTVAYRINLFCAICTSLAALLIGFTVKRLSGVHASIGGSVAAMGMFAFSPLIWQYAITAEVFPLNTFFATLIVYLVVVFSQSKNNISIAYIGAFICGLALCNQHTIVLFEVPLILWMLFLLRNHILHDYSVLIKLSVSFLFGILPYAYLPIAALIAPKPGSWGQVDTFNGFLHHVLRRDYGTFQLFSGEQGKSAEGFSARNDAYLLDFSGTQTSSTGTKEIGIVGNISLVLILIGVLVGLTQVSIQSNNTKNTKNIKKSTQTPIKSNRKTAVSDTRTTSTTMKTNEFNTNKQIESNNIVLNIFECSFTSVVLVVTFVFYFSVFHSLSNLPLRDRLLYGVHQRFWMQPNILMFIWLGIGWNALCGWICAVLPHTNTNNANTLNKTVNNPSISRNTMNVYTTTIHIIFTILAILLVLKQYYTWHPVLDMSTNTHFSDYATAVLNPLPQDSIILINYDQQWTSVRYMQVCEGVRSDITALQLSMMTYAWFESKRELYPNIKFPGKEIAVVCLSIYYIFNDVILYYSIYYK